MSDISNRPIVRLKPKADARRLRWGAPWVEARDLVLDRRTKALVPGRIVAVQDADRGDLGTAAFHPEARIALRMLDTSPEAEIDQAWLTARVARAASLRDRMFETPFYRLINAEADGLPGLIVDRFGETAVIQPNAAWIDTRLDDLVAALGSLGVTTCLKNASGRSRSLEGLDDQSAVLSGTAPEAPVPVTMNGATYLADLVGGQKTGLFYDQRPNHQFVASLCRDARVLDVFSHVGGFGLAAAAGGATEVLCVDGSDPALSLAMEGARATGVEDRVTTRKGDAFDVMTELLSRGETFDVVICDPPAFAPNKGAMAAGLRAYERVARLGASLVAPDGILTLCSCSHAADLKSFSTASVRGMGKAGRQGRLIHTGFAGPDHPLHPVLTETGYLKAQVWRLD